MAQTDFDVDVAIVGAGPVGLMMAAVLGQAGISAQLIERRHSPHSEPRAIAYDADTLRLFQKVGAYAALEPSLELDVPVSYFNGAGKLLLRATRFGRPFGHSQLGTFYQPELEAALAETVAAYPSVTIRRGVEARYEGQSTDSVTLSLSGEGTRSTLRARYVVACDGGASPMRHALGIPFEGATYGEKWLVVDTEGDDLGVREMHFYCDPARPSLTVPVSKGRRRWEFLIMPGDDEDAIVSEASVRALMSKYGAGQAQRIERSLVYTFHSRMAARFRDGRVFLAGDAAHVMPPFAGQGMNSGLRDAANLGWKLAAICEGRAGPGLLDTYEAERRKHVKAMTKLAEGLGTMVMPTSRIGAAVRDAVCLSLMAIPPVRQKLDDGVIVPPPSIAKTALMNTRAGRRVGTMIPQPDVTVDGAARPLDDLLGPGFCLLGIGCAPEEVLSPADLRIADKLKTTRVALNMAGQPSEAGGVLHTWSGKRPKLVLLRPDRFVADIIPAKRAPHQPGRLAWLQASHHLH